MSKPIFLTQEYAALVDGCAREIKAHAGLYLLHGERGVGKSRLLGELSRRKLGGEVRWIDLGAGADGAGADGDAALVDSSELIEKTFASANPGDVIVADHFEMALKKSRHQLLLSWSTEGIDKQLNLVIGSSNDDVEELRQLAQHYQVRIESFEVRPFGVEDVQAFLGFYLFPEQTVGKLSMPRALRRQLALAHGNVSEIIEIVELAGERIVNRSGSPILSSTSASQALAAALLVAVILAAGGWYLLAGGEQAAIATQAATTQSGGGDLPATAELALQTDRDDTQQIEVAVASPGVIDAPAVVRVPVETETGHAAANDSGRGQDAEMTAAVSIEPVELQPTWIDTTVDEAVAANNGAVTDSPGIASEAADAADVEVTITYYEDLVDDQPETPPAPAEIEFTVQPVHVSLNQEISESERLRQDLDASLQWIDARDGATGTLQILLLSKARFDAESYYQHIRELEREGVDITRLKIVETFTGGRETYSVLYGEYPSRVAAAEARVELVSVLREAAPIARSVGSLRTEIRRLTVQN